MANTAESFSVTDLSDGFRQVLHFSGHNSPVCGMSLLEVQEEKEFCADRRDKFLSWDSMNAYVWIREHQSSRSPRIVHTLKFPSGCKGFITSIIYVAKLRVFLASALDLTFKIYDKSLNLIESIRHDQRSLGCLTLHTMPDGKEILVAASAIGVSLWRIYRDSSSTRAFALERQLMYDDAGVAGTWVTKLEVDKTLHNVYAFSGTSVFVLSLTRRRMLHRLERIHEVNLTVIVWYGRSQFYLTGCTGGLIKCWTALGEDGPLAKAKRAQAAAAGLTATNEDETTFTCLHTFRLNSAAVTGLVLHPISGMAISTSLDCTIRILNLENFTEIYKISMDGVGIISLKLLDYVPAGRKAIMFADVNCHIRVWKVASATGFPFFGIMNSNAVSLTKFENMHEEKLHRFFKHSDPVMRMRKLVDVNGKMAESTVYKDVSNFGKRDSDSESGSDDEGSSAPLESKKSSRQSSFAVSVAAGANATDAALKAAQTEKLNANTLRAITEAENKRSRAFLSNSYVGCLGTGPQDLRIFSGAPQGGIAIGALEPELLVDGIVAYTVSVYQSLLFCIFESGLLMVFCCRSFDSPLLLEVELAQPGGAIEHEVGTCLSLIDELPSSAHRPGGKANAKYLFDIRGNQCPFYVTEVLVMGSKSGSLLFFDTLNACSLCHQFPTAQQFPVVDLAYRHRTKELFVVGSDGTSRSRLRQGGGSGGGGVRGPGRDIVVRVFSLPSLECLLEVRDLQDVTTFCVSASLPNFGAGLEDGDVRVFVLSHAKPSGGAATAGTAVAEGGHAHGQPHHPTSRGTITCMELLKQHGVESKGPDRAHKAPVTCMAFCDEMSLYATGSADQVVMIWTLSKLCVRSISYNMPLTCLVFNGPPGTLVLSQNNYLLPVPQGIWNSGNALQNLLDSRDQNPWAVGRARGSMLDDGDGDSDGDHDDNDDKKNGSTRVVPAGEGLATVQKGQENSPLTVGAGEQSAGEVGTDSAPEQGPARSQQRHALMAEFEALRKSAGSGSPERVAKGDHSLFSAEALLRPSSPTSTISRGAGTGTAGGGEEQRFAWPGPDTSLGPGRATALASSLRRTSPHSSPFLPASASSPSAPLLLDTRHPRIRLQSNPPVLQLGSGPGTGTVQGRENNAMTGILISPAQQASTLGSGANRPRKLLGPGPGGVPALSLLIGSLAFGARAGAVLLATDEQKLVAQRLARRPTSASSSGPIPASAAAAPLSSALDVAALVPLSFKQQKLTFQRAQRGILFGAQAGLVQAQDLEALAREAEAEAARLKREGHHSGYEGDRSGRRASQRRASTRVSRKHSTSTSTSTSIRRPSTLFGSCIEEGSASPSGGSPGPTGEEMGRDSASASPLTLTLNSDEAAGSVPRAPEGPPPSRFSGASRRDSSALGVHFRIEERE